MKIHNSFVRTAFILVLTLFARTNSFSQSIVNLNENVSIRQFNQILDTCSSKDVIINVHHGILTFRGDSGKREAFGRSDKNLEFIFIRHFHDLKFENLTALSNIWIREENSNIDENAGSVRLEGTYGISNCRFKKELAVFTNRKDLTLKNSLFEERYWETLNYSSSNSSKTTYNKYGGDLSNGYSILEDCSISEIQISPMRNFTDKSGTLKFKKCTINKLQNSEIEYQSIKGSFTSISFDSCTILSPLKFIGDCKSIIITSSGHPQFDFSELTFPEDPFRIQIPISDLENDPVVTYFHYFKYQNKKVEISGKMSQLEKNLIVASYRKLLDAYKANGDQDSYNKLYRYSKRAKNLLLIQQKDKNLNTWFEFYFNRFLDWYCDYGTNPVKGLIYSFYLVLIFAGLFILFPSEPDNLQRHFFIEKIGKYLSYFSSDSHLADLKRKEYEQELAELEDFRLNLEDTIKKAPSIIPWISKPYYRISMMYFNIHLWLLEKVDFARLSWNRMSKNQRIKASLIMTVYMFGFIFWGIVVRVMNGLALSMNAFITLGYGEITAKGIARYLAVVEGCMGWFLLSIFSVSLIAQMMQ